MLFKDYIKIINSTEETKNVEYGYRGWACTVGIMRCVSLSVKSINDPESEVIKLPKRALNRWGDEVGVMGLLSGAFQGNDRVTDIILHSKIYYIPEGAFGACKNLKRITIPRCVRNIRRNVFAGCVSLEDIYYEGTKEEWEKVEIYTGKRIVEMGKQIPGTPVCEVAADYFKHDPGNDALLKANIHFQCVFDPDK